MVINWTNILANLAALCAVLAFIWKGSRVVEKAIRDSAVSKAEAETRTREAEARARADRARFENLWSIVEIHGEVLSDVQIHLSLPPAQREKTDFHVRSSTTRLEQKGFERLASHRTDFT
ncbi:hypothetical protein [Microcoleus asticus]|uniref:Uncharacterized protein n=1 Tax=Microcoleus asticus IPMA8 TaxID=2563858 RepID=A0ABX2D6V7_9CYAN|nr:hypothetical protein [Microcoleus asticus]NQE38377.1 hypothetical protein [Microcoleus asticus IPMA8]